MSILVKSGFFRRVIVGRISCRRRLAGLLVLLGLFGLTLAVEIGSATGAQALPMTSSGLCCPMDTSPGTGASSSLCFLGGGPSTTAAFPCPGGTGSAPTPSVSVNEDASQARSPQDTSQPGPSPPPTAAAAGAARPTVAAVPALFLGCTRHHTAMPPADS